MQSWRESIACNEAGRSGYRATLAYYEERDCADWTHAVSGARVLKAQHPEFELYSRGIHGQNGVAWADCHMPYPRVGAMKVSDHRVRSPMLNVDNAWQTCHRSSEDELRGRVHAMQDRTYQLRDIAIDATLALAKAIQRAQQRDAEEVRRGDLPAADRPRPDACRRSRDGRAGWGEWRLTSIDMRRAAAVLGLAVLIPAGSVGAQTFAVEIGGGPVWQSYNDVEIPNDGTATRFSLRDLAGGGPWPAARFYLTWNLSERHGLRLLLAPFSLTETGVPSRQIHFAGASYEAGTAAEATYTFNSYRLTWRYRWRSDERIRVWAGFTAKIRDAVIALEQGETSSRKEDLGFVPLLHVAGEWTVASGWKLGLDVDGLAGGPGRAIDAALELHRDVGERWTVQAGYRMVEGGADVTDVYTFAWLHYAAVSLVYRR